MAGDKRQGKQINSVRERGRQRPAETRIFPYGKEKFSLIRKDRSCRSSREDCSLPYEREMFSPVQERNILSRTGEILLLQNLYETFLSRTGERASPSQKSHRTFLSRTGKILLSFLSFFPVRERTSCFPPRQEKFSPVRERLASSLPYGRE